MEFYLSQEFGLELILIERRLIAGLDRIVIKTISTHIVGEAGKI